MANDPYIRLARHRPFVLFWVGQTISQLGDRLNQVALAVLVYGTTNSPLLTALVFVAGMLPNIVMGPLGGVAADRFDRRKLMIATDLVRAGLVLTIPFVVGIKDIGPVLSLFVVFAVTCASLLFRPAKIAVIPDIAPAGQLQAASGATWLSDALADLLGYPIAGVIVALLGPAIALAFVLDAASYLVSALCIWPLPIKIIVQAEAIAGQSAVRRVQADLLEGWRFLRHTAALFENTMLSMVAQLSIGINVALLVVYAKTALEGGGGNFPIYYAALNTATGVGAVVGSVMAGRLLKIPRGPLILIGFLLMGLSVVWLGLVNNIWLATVTMFTGAIANLAWIVPTQALFLELTPDNLRGRVFALRGAFVFGAITAAMVGAGLAASVVPAATVIVAGGLLTIAAAAFGFTRSALRHPGSLRAPG